MKPTIKNALIVTVFELLGEVCVLIEAPLEVPVQSVVSDSLGHREPREYVFSSNGRWRASLHTLPAYPRRDTTEMSLVYLRLLCLCLVTSSLLDTVAVLSITISMRIVCAT